MLARLTRDLLSLCAYQEEAIDLALGLFVQRLVSLGKPATVILVQNGLEWALKS